MKLLLVEDDPELLGLLVHALGRDGYQIITAAGGQQALERWQAERPDLVVLDVNLPEIDGFEVCRRIRHESDTPVIMLTGRGQDADVIRGLQVGADDYVTKPFSVRQLAARIQSVLRRTQQDRARRPAQELCIGDLVLDQETHGVTRGGVPVALTRLEFRLLYLLAMNAGQVVPYARLIEFAWGTSEEGSTSVLRTHLSHVRRKVGLGASGPGALQSVGGVGYTFTRPAPPTADHHPRPRQAQ
jgi:DNA-binding response OmpR family regulator